MGKVICAHCNKVIRIRRVLVSYQRKRRTHNIFRKVFNWHTIYKSTYHPQCWEDL